MKITNKLFIMVTLCHVILALFNTSLFAGEVGNGYPYQKYAIVDSKKEAKIKMEDFVAEIKAEYGVDLKQKSKNRYRFSDVDSKITYIVYIRNNKKFGESGYTVTMDIHEIKNKRRESTLYKQSLLQYQ